MRVNNKLIQKKITRFYYFLFNKEDTKVIYLKKEVIKLFLRHNFHGKGKKDVVEMA